ncbi:MAG: glycosyltransferase [bacterium]|nr:glycosyltransferase [bacterium]
MKKPQVTVCIPVYNCVRFVAQAIESVLGQTFNDYELVILDDCSTDGSWEIIAKYSDTRIKRIKHQTNKGLAASWNRLLSEASGTYLKILPHDDILYPTCLERQVSVMVAQPEIALVSCARHIIDNSGAIVAKRGFSHVTQILSGAEAVRAVVRSGTNPIGEPGSVLFRHAHAERCGSFEGTLLYVIDLQYYCRLLQYGGLCALHEPLCMFRVSGDSTSVHMMHRQAREFIAFARSLARTSPTLISRIDFIRAALMAGLNNILRMVFYGYLAIRHLCRARLQR